MSARRTPAAVGTDGAVQQWTEAAPVAGHFRPTTTRRCRNGRVPAPRTAGHSRGYFRAKMALQLSPRTANIRNPRRARTTRPATRYRPIIGTPELPDLRTARQLLLTSTLASVSAGLDADPEIRIDHTP